MDVVSGDVDVPLTASPEEEAPVAVEVAVDAETSVTVEYEEDTISKVAFRFGAHQQGKGTR